MRVTETGLLHRLGHTVAKTRVATNKRKASVREEERHRAEAAAGPLSGLCERERGERKNCRLPYKLVS